MKIPTVFKAAQEGTKEMLRKIQMGKNRGAEIHQSGVFPPNSQRQVKEVWEGSYFPQVASGRGMTCLWRCH